MVLEIAGKDDLKSGTAFMDMEFFDNIVMLAASVTGLLLSLFRYIERPKRGWLYVTAFFLAHILSDYYWTVYTLVTRDAPEVSAFMAYFGWNVGYLLLVFAVLHMRSLGAKRYFHPLMLLPIPLNIWQFILYIQYGGLLNNLWQEAITTIVAILCLQSLLYYFKNRRSVHFPFTHLLIFLFLTTEYGMWTSSCFFYSGDPKNPYYYFALANYITMVFFAWGVGKDYEARGLRYPQKSAAEMKIQVLMQMIASFIIIIGFAGGYFIALRMKNALAAAGEESYSVIAVTLFVISIVLVMMIAALLFIIAHRYRSSEYDTKEVSEAKRSRFSFIFTILITLILMIFSVVYTSRLFYKVSVESVNGSGEETASLVAAELGNYLSDARSILEVTADTVDLMVQSGESQDNIYRLLLYQTKTQAEQIDENFTGIYAYVRGDYLDGLGWTPPKDYDVKSRDWYKEALAAEGRSVLVSPYVDAQTNSVVITVSKQISDDKTQSSYDGRNVVALDVIVNHIQDIIENADINGKGYAMVVNIDGLIVAHHDRKLVGQNVKDYISEELFGELIGTKKGVLDAEIDGEDSTLFINRLMDQWYIVITVSDTGLMEDARSQLTVNVIVSFFIFALISVFYFLGYKNEQTYGRKMDEMRISKQKQDYEAQVLKLEKAAADEANKAKSGFLADMSHEIRTPINAILGMNEMILREASGSNIREYARNIDASGRNLLQLINSILDFSKIEDGKMDIVPVRYSTKTLITYLINSVSERAKKKDLKLIVDIDPDIPSELYGDETRVSQVIMNLLTNAVKYTPEGSVTLTMKGMDKNEGEVLLYVEVSDTGIGIRESDMGRLFESFERLDVVRNRNIEGTGLGMAITTKLLKLMGSGLKVESTYGEGSVFSFELWQEIVNDDPVGDYRMSAGDEGLKKAEGAFYAPDARILVTDDTQMNLIVVVNLLKRTGIQTDTAINGSEAINLCEQNDYDVILMDQRMPGMDGTETLKHIRELENGKNKNTPVICLTADAIRGARERYIADGFDDYLTKPIDGDSLERALLRYLPEEKLGEKPLADEGEAKEEAVSEDTLFEALHKAGLDTGHGLSFCQNDEDIYREILTEYVKDQAVRSERLNRFYEEKAWDSYMIEVHSLKSTSKTIGATQLSDIAAGLEEAAREKDEALIIKDHWKAEELYEKTAGVIAEYIGIDITKPQEADEDEILEFSPEE